MMVVGGGLQLNNWFGSDVKKRAKTFYGLTDKNVILVQDDFVVKLSIPSLEQFSINEAKDGSGTLSFQSIELKEYFEEEFFDTKKVVYLPL